MYIVKLSFLLGLLPLLCTGNQGEREREPPPPQGPHNDPPLELTHLISKKPCGDFFCGQGSNKYEYCSDTDHICKSCEDVCNPGLRNKFDLERCQTSCQDYLHDARYATQTEFIVEMDRLGKELRLIKILISVALGSISLLLCCFLGGFVFLLRRQGWKGCGKGKKKGGEPEDPKKEGVISADKDKYLQEEIIMNIMNNINNGNTSNNSAQTSETSTPVNNNPNGGSGGGVRRFQKKSELLKNGRLGSREPSESTLPTPEYYYNCYDNPSLVLNSSGASEEAQTGSPHHTYDSTTSGVTQMTATTPLSARDLMLNFNNHQMNRDKGPPPPPNPRSGSIPNGTFSLSGSHHPLNV